MYCILLTIVFILYQGHYLLTTATSLSAVHNCWSVIFTFLIGDDADDISSSGTEDNADVHSSDVEFKGAWL